MKCYKCKEEHLPGCKFCQNCGNDLSTLTNPPPKMKKPGISPDAKCPTCGSNNMQRISPGGKTAKVFAFGVFGLGDVHKIFRCLNCGYKW